MVCNRSQGAVVIGWGNSLIRELWYSVPMVQTHISLRGVVAWFSRHKHRFGLLVVGHTAKQLEELLFDWVLYGAVVAWSVQAWGTYRGSLIALGIMGTLSALMCLLYLRFYDWSGRDWFGFEMLKELRDEEQHDTRIEKWLHRLMRLGSLPAFLLLSIHADPFMTTVYFRHKQHQFKGLTRRDWMVFWGSVAVSNLYWTLQWTVIVEVGKWLWSYVSTLLGA